MDVQADEKEKSIELTILIHDPAQRGGNEKSGCDSERNE